MTGRLCVNKPYKNQVKVPNVNIEYIAREMEEVSLVRIIFTAWGTKETVVQIAANNPAAAIQSIFL